MGGGEVVRYFNWNAGANVWKVVLVSLVIPHLAISEDNPEWRLKEKNEATQFAIKEDKIAFLGDFGKDSLLVGFFNTFTSTTLLNYYKLLTPFASPHATTECTKSFSNANFRQEVLSIKVSALILHGNADKIVPIEISSERTTALIVDNKFIIYDDAPHDLFHTDKNKLNDDLLEFLTRNLKIKMVGICKMTTF